MLTLGIETSCDETSVALLEGESHLLSHLVLSQLEHERFGGVVPELASRAHLKALLPMLEQAFEEASLSPREIDLIGVTVGSGADRFPAGGNLHGQVTGFQPGQAAGGGEPRGSSSHGQPTAA